MSLPKKGSRKLYYHDEEYRWMVGKTRQVKSKDGVDCNMADLVVETPEGRLLKEAMLLKVEDGDVIPVTTKDAIDLIEANL